MDNGDSPGSNRDDRSPSREEDDNGSEQNGSGDENDRSPRPVGRSRSRSPVDRKSKRSRSRSPRRNRGDDDRRKRSRSPRRTNGRSYSRGGGGGGGAGTGNGDTQRENPPAGRCLGIFGLSIYTQERDLRDVFGKYGRIDQVQIVFDAQSGRSRGFAFVYYENKADAAEVRALMFLIPF